MNASCSAGQSGGGGGIAVYSTRVALEKVNLKQCRAGTGGGGSLLLGGEAEVDLLECPPLPFDIESWTLEYELERLSNIRDVSVTTNPSDCTIASGSHIFMVEFHAYPGALQ